jgi:hypothetical protein
MLQSKPDLVSGMPKGERCRDRFLNSIATVGRIAPDQGNVECHQYAHSRKFHPNCSEFVIERTSQAR